MTSAEFSSWFVSVLTHVVTVPALGACHVWPYGRLKSGGYGTVWFQGKLHRAHRLAFELHHAGVVPALSWVLHHCDNPPCCNPAHLYAGDDADNARDRVLRGRNVEPTPRYGVDHHAAKLSTYRVRLARRRFAAGETVEAIGHALGVTPSTVHAAIIGKTWSNVPGAVDLTKRVRGARRDSTTGVRGVTMTTKGLRPYVATMTTNGNRREIGRYKTIEEASAALALARKLI